MKLSFNEIQVTCYKAYFGLHRNNGEADKISFIVANNEIIGLPGITSFANALKRLKSDNDLIIDLDIHDNKIIVDLKKRSVIENITILLDQMIDILQNYANVTLQIDNANNRWLCIGALVELVKNFPDVNVIAKWNYATPDNEVICIFCAGNIYPEIYCNKESNYLKKNYQTLTIIIDRQMTTASFPSIIYSRETLKYNHQKNIETGINVSKEDFKIIQQFSAAILVEETQDSYKNAG